MNEKNGIDILKNGKFLSRLLPCSIVASIAFDLGYFLSIGISFSSAPTSVADHVSGWLLRLPYLLAIVGIIVVGDMSYHRILESPGRARPLSEALKRNGDKVFYRTALGLGVMMTLLYFIGWVELGPFMIGLSLITMWIANRVFNTPSIGEKFGWEMTLIQLVLPITLLGFGLGYLSGSHCYKFSGHSIGYQSLSTVHPTESRNVRVMRNFENWQLVRDQQGNLSWMNKNNLQQIDFRKTKISASDLICL